MLLAALALVLALTGAQRANAQDVTTVVVQPAEAQIGVGQETTLEIAIRGAVNLYALELQLTYDSAIVEVVDDQDATPGVQVALAGGLLKPEFVVQNEADNGSGVVRLAFTQLAPSAPANGDGVVATVRLRGKAAGTSAVSFAEVVLANDEALPVPAGTGPGTVMVGGGGTGPANQPTATSPSAQTAAIGTPTLPAAGAPAPGPVSATATTLPTATSAPQTAATAPPAEATISATIVAQAAATEAATAPASSTAVPATATPVAAGSTPPSAPTTAPVVQAASAAAASATSGSETAEATLTSTPVVLAEAAAPTAAAAPTISAALEVPAQSSALGSLWVIAAVVGVLIIGFGVVIALPRGRRGRA